MLGNNTNKLVWVAVAVGIVGLLGLTTITMFPDTLTTAESYIHDATARFTDSNYTDKPDTKDDFSYYFNSEDYTVSVTGWSGNGDDSVDAPTLTIPDTVVKDHHVYKVTSITGTIVGNSTITKLVLPNSLETIVGGGFMASASNLHSFNVPDNFKGNQSTLYGSAQWSDKSTAIKTSVPNGFGFQSLRPGNFAVNPESLNTVSVPSSWTMGDIVSFSNQLESSIGYGSDKSVEIYQSGNYMGVLRYNRGQGYFLTSNYKVYSVQDAYSQAIGKFSPETMSEVPNYGSTTNANSTAWAYVGTGASRAYAGSNETPTMDYYNYYDSSTGHMKLVDK